VTGPQHRSLLLTLHAVRLLGFADTNSIAERFGQDPADVERSLIEAGANGWALRSSFAATRGWSLTVAGRAENERLLAAELNSVRGHSGVSGVHSDFLSLNTNVVAACSRIQLQWLSDGHPPTDGIDEETRQTFIQALTSLRGLEVRLTALLPRFSGYADRLEMAVANAATDPAWLTATDRDSFHRVWFELHEDLIATLGIQR
jgi:NAD(P)-dependent dehydrogenase (short-subunit alcohol dehydrogenase family)